MGPSHLHRIATVPYRRISFIFGVDYGGAAVTQWVAAIVRASDCLSTGAASGDPPGLTAVGSR